MVKMKERGLSKGFTLIELLVVIAIIGILAAVILASLGSARQKGADAAVKSDMDSMRAQGELSASNNGNSYASVCSDATVIKQLQNAYSSEGQTYSATCYNEASDWAAYAPLSGSPATYWCVDSTGDSSSTQNTTPVYSSGTSGSENYHCQ